jgi:hypothetical protein
LKLQYIHIIIQELKLERRMQTNYILLILGPVGTSFLNKKLATLDKKPIPCNGNELGRI